MSDCESDVCNVTTHIRKKAKLSVTGLTKDRKQLLGDTATTFADMGVNILESNDTNIKIVESSGKSSLGLKAKVVSKSIVREIEEFENLFSCRKKLNKDSENIDWFSKLSDEMVLAIFRWLPKIVLNKCALVCKRWKRLTEDESLWIRLDCGLKCLRPGSLGHIISRQVVVLRLAESEINEPIFSPPAKACAEDFLSKLLYLDLSMAIVSPKSLEDLFSKCTRLKKLSLEACTVNDKACAYLGRNENLEVLNMSMTEGLTAVGVRSIVVGCKKIKELNIAWTNLSTEALNVLCTDLSEVLDRLNLSGFRKTLNDKHVVEIVKRCLKLRELDLSDCISLTGKVINYVTRLNNLQFLALARCYGIHHSCLSDLAKIPSLMYLNIYGGHMEQELSWLKNTLGSNVKINEFSFSSVARPTVGNRRSSIWGLQVRD